MPRISAVQDAQSWTWTQSSTRPNLRSFLRSARQERYHGLAMFAALASSQRRRWKQGRWSRAVYVRSCKWWHLSATTILSRQPCLHISGRQFRRTRLASRTRKTEKDTHISLFQATLSLSHPAVSRDSALLLVGVLAPLKRHHARPSHLPSGLCASKEGILWSD